MVHYLGVDIGTTYAAGAVWREGRVEIANLGIRSPVIPSVVFLKEDNSVLTGEAANRRGRTEPGRVAREFKRRLGDTTPIILGGSPHSADALMAELLRWVVDAVAEVEGGPPAGIAVVHPANWGPFKLDLLRQAIERADLDDVTTLTEPEAAAIHYASQSRVEPGSIIAVYDLGGGTFDAAVLRKTQTGFEILGEPQGIERLGGVDFDEAVFQHVVAAIGSAMSALDPDDSATIAGVARLRQECVEAKEALSSDTEAAIPVLLPGVQTEVRLTRGEFEDMVRPVLGGTITALQRALRSAGVGTDEVTAVVLVGGSSRIPLVTELVGRELGRPVAVDAHPKHGVALGAAIAAAEGARAGVAESTVVIDVVETAEPAAAAVAAISTAAALLRPPVPRVQPAPERAAPTVDPEPGAHDHPSVEPRAIEPPGAAPGRPSRRRRAAIAAGVGLVLLVAGLAVVLRPDDGTDVDTTPDVPRIDGVVDEGDLWVAAVAKPGAVVKVDRDTATVVGSIAIDGIKEEAVVTDDAVWVAAIDAAEGVVVHRLDRGDPTRDVRLPLDLDDAASIELVRRGQGVWAVCVPTSGPATVVGVDADGDLTTRTEVGGAQRDVEPVADGERLFVPSIDGVVRIDRDGKATAKTLPGEVVGSTPALSDGRLFVLRNDRLIEVDADTMDVIRSQDYALDGETTSLLENGEKGIEIEGAYGDGNVLTFLASDAGMSDGAFFFRIDADTGEVVARRLLSRQQKAGGFDLRRGAGVFWAYLSTGEATLLRIDDRGRVRKIPLPARGEIDPDLVANGGRLIISDVDTEGRPIFHVIDPERETVEPSLPFHS